ADPAIAAAEAGAPSVAQRHVVVDRGRPGQVRHVGHAVPAQAGVDLEYAPGQVRVQRHDDGREVLVQLGVVVGAIEAQGEAGDRAPQQRGLQAAAGGLAAVDQAADAVDQRGDLDVLPVDLIGDHV